MGEELDDEIPNDEQVNEMLARNDVLIIIIYRMN
jgi:hypothetical protein